MESHEYWQGVSSKSLAQKFERHACQTQDCIVKQKAEEKRKIEEFVRVHGVVAIQLGKVTTYSNDDQAIKCFSFFAS